MEDQLKIESFFESLLTETKSRFVRSPIYNKQVLLGKSWNYSICATPISIGKPVLFGINWGGGEYHEPQKHIPDGEDIYSYKFIQRSKPYLTKYLKLDFSSADFNYSNLCFFRSPKLSDLSLEDFELSIPLFKKFLEFIEPPWVLCMGSTNFSILEHFGLVKDIRTYFDNQNRFKGHTANLFDFQLISVPHPNARLNNATRESIWQQVTNNVSFR